MRALITGGLEFIGSNLADRRLRQGNEVVVCDNAGRVGVRHNLDQLRSPAEGLQRLASLAEETGAILK